MAETSEGDVAELRTSLLTALDDFRQVANIAPPLPFDRDVKSFYYALFLRCSSLHLSLAENADAHSIRSFVPDALKRLESLVITPPASGKVQEQNRHTFPGLETLHQTLTTLDDSQLKLKVLQERVNFGEKEERSALLDFLLYGCIALKSKAQTGFLDNELAHPREIRKRPPDHVRFAAKSLFRVLKSKSKRACNCEPGHKHIVQLSLETHQAQINSCDFDLYFGLERIWQEARVQTSACMSPKRLVVKLCNDIKSITKRFPDYRLRFSLEKDRLWKLQSEESDFVIDKSKAPISLTQLLNEEPIVLNERIKRILSVLLSYAVLHLHETSWLSPIWGSCNVMFFRSSGGLPMRPYLSAQLSDDSATVQVDPRSTDNDGKEFDPDDLFIPPYPCLIGLAIVLMELHKASSLRSLSEVYKVQLNDETDLANRFITAKAIFERCSHEFTDMTRMAIDACLDPNIGLDDSGEDLDDTSLQSIIYERIVCRLEHELEQGFRDVAVDQLDKLIQRLDITNGGRQIRETRKHNVVRLNSTRIVTSSSTKLEINHATRLQPLSTDVVEGMADKLSPPTTICHNLEGIKPFQKQTGSASKIMASNTASVEDDRDLIIPIVPRKLPEDRPDTLRVMNIPDDMSISDLSKKLEHHFAWECKIHSLTRASRDARWKKYATVTFPGMANSVLNETINKLQRQSLTNAFEYDKSFLGLTPLHNGGDSAILDIIVIEGLGTNPFGTFRAPQGDQMWLRDFLPQSFPSSRVLLYGYDSRVPESMSNQSVPEIASTCKSIVMNHRRLTKTEERPIVWLGQSMGGLIIQELLVQANRYKSPNSSGTLSSRTIGFLGYGVPINGLKNETLLTAVKSQPNFEMIRSICLDADGRPSRYLVDLANRFALCNERMTIHHFYETNPSPDIWDPEAMPSRRVEHQEVIGRENMYWVSRNHSELVKVPNRADIVYTTTEQVISLIHIDHELHSEDH